MAEMSQAAEASTQATANADKKPIYEVGYHVVPTVGEEGVAAVVDVVRAAVERAHGEILKDQFPQKMQLAYQIERSAQGKREKYTESFFGFIKFATDKEYITELEAALRGEPRVLRFLLVETVREEEAPRRALFTSDRLEGEVIKKPTVAEEGGEVSDAELEKSLDALTQ